MLFRSGGRITYFEAHETKKTSFRSELAAAAQGRPQALVMVALPDDTGVPVLRQALEVPARTIAENSAADGGVVVGDLRRGSGAHGFDAARNVYCDLVEAGIVDPTKVVRVALENAVSVAGTLLLTEATLAEVEEPKDERAHPELAAEM